MSPSTALYSFRDRDELPATGDPTEQIKRGLRESKFLIVICSPDAKRSKWVSEEIKVFKALGKRRSILAVNVRGEPPAESFPDELRFDMGPSGTSKRQLSACLLESLAFTRQSE